MLRKKLELLSVFVHVGTKSARISLRGTKSASGFSTIGGTNPRGDQIRCYTGYLNKLCKKLARDCMYNTEPRICLKLDQPG